jgi:hypothetical protein
MLLFISEIIFPPSLLLFIFLKIYQFKNPSLESDFMFSSKAFNSLYFNTGAGPLMINEVLSTLFSFISYIDHKNLPKPSVEGQNTSTLNSESEYNIYSATSKVRKLSNAYLKPQEITETLSRPATPMIQE